MVTTDPTLIVNRMVGGECGPQSKGCAMSELEIPERAYEAAWKVFGVDPAPQIDYRELVERAAPIIVAAELRRMADQAESSETDSMWGRRELRYRADELDPEGSGQ